MPVMGEKKNLSLLSQLAKNFEPGSSANIIEIDEQVVNDERKGVRPGKIVLDRGYAQRQIQLVGCTRAQAADVNQPPVGSKTCQLGAILFIELNPELTERAPGKHGEDLACTFEQRRLFLPSIALDGPL